MKNLFKSCSLILLIILCFSTPLSVCSKIITSDEYACQNESPFIKGSMIPKHLYVIYEDDMSKEERTMIATLQGLLASKSPYQIYIIPTSQPDYNVWLKDLNRHHKITYTNVKNSWELLKKFKFYVQGYVLYDTLNAPSINNACSLASLSDSIVIDKSLEAKVNSYGLINLIQDCSDTDINWAFNNIWNSGLNHSTVIELSPEKSTALRDYAIMSKSLMFYEDEVNTTSLRESIFKSMDENSHCIGWGPDEHINVRIASKYGVSIVAADWSYNLSVFSSFPSSPKIQKLNTKVPTEDGVHYVTFIMSDGDNQQWFLGNNFTSPKWFGSSKRGNFNLGWSISPSLYYLAPTVFDEYYKAGSRSKYHDYFVVPPSGTGYMYPSQFPISKLESFTTQLDTYMKKVDQNYVVIIDDDSFYKTDLWDKYTLHTSIAGLFYLNYAKHNDYKGKIIWSKGKPVVSCRDLLWSGLEEENQLIDTINSRVNLGYTNIKDPNSYTFVYVHVWSKTIDSVQDTVAKLNENPKVRIVTPDVFMKLIKNNIKE